jgi:hypothetical protein
MFVLSTDLPFPVGTPAWRRGYAPRTAHLIAGRSTASAAPI